MAWMSSITNTVLPTPAPPNIAAFPPWASGARRSITLTPVENRRVAPVWAANAGGLRWIGQRGASAGRGGPRSPIRPRTSIRRPSDRLADLDRDRPAGAARPIAAPQSRRRLERDRARRTGVELGLDFGDDNAALRIHDFDRVVDRRRAILEHEVDHRAANRRHPALKSALSGY